ncbi:MAG: histidine kinase [Butyrivibrio sp.]|nr:histidine kinase [Butyrivibrio sp.]
MVEIKYFYTDLELLGAVFCLLASGYLIVSRSIVKRQFRELCYLEGLGALMLFFDAFAWFFRGETGTFAHGAVALTNFMSFALNSILPVFFIRYSISSLRERNKSIKVLYASVVISFIQLFFLIVSLINGFVYTIDKQTNLYQRGPGFPLFAALSVLQLIIGIVHLIFNRRNLDGKRFFALLSFGILPLASIIIQIFFYGYSLSNIAVIISLLIMFAQALGDNAHDMIAQEMHIRKQNDELVEMRTKIALSQIKPEFVYDALNSISDLCDRNIGEAKQMISYLSEYLKENIASIDTEKLIPFENELRHTQVYLEIEKARFKDRINVEYDLETTDFELPPLTVQPIVENAIRHGFDGSDEQQKINIRIKTIKGNGYVKVQVSDDGNGFDVDKLKSSDFSYDNHIGIKNVRGRLRLMEDAEVHVKSKLGVGTTVDMIIPKRMG